MNVAACQMCDQGRWPPVVAAN